MKAARNITVSGERESICFIIGLFTIISINNNSMFYLCFRQSFIWVNGSQMDLPILPGLGSRMNKFVLDHPREQSMTFTLQLTNYINTCTHPVSFSLFSFNGYLLCLWLFCVLGWWGSCGCLNKGSINSKL